jgi:hypothetical protein
MALLSDLRTIIMTAIPTETAVFLFKEPDAPPAAVTLYANGGPEAEQTFDGASHGERSVQVRVRDPLASGCESRCEALHRAFIGIRTSNGYLSIVASSAPFFGYPPGKKGETIGSFNIRCEKRV